MKFLKTLKTVKGMTLVELIVSMALLSIVLMLMCSTFLLAFQLLSKSSIQKKHSMHAAAGIELTTISSTNSDPSATVSQIVGTFQISFNRTIVTVPGSYLLSSDFSGDVHYKSFIPASQ